MFILSLVLLAAWLLAVGMFSVGGPMIHFVLVGALIAFGWHLRDKAKLRTFATNHRPRR
jgi:hypothetical protein